MTRFLFVHFPHHSSSRRYRGWREGHAVVVTVDDEPLPLCLELCNHSPTGFEWGYQGSGPAQLALAILVDHLADSEQALALHQTFKQHVVARFPYEGWTLTTSQIAAVLAGLVVPLPRRIGVRFLP